MGVKLLVSRLESVLQESKISSLAALPPMHDIQTLFHRIITLAAESNDRSRLPLAMSQKIVQYLYKSQTRLGREVYVTLLEHLCQSYDDVAKEAITWLIYAEDEVSFPSVHL